MYAKAHQRGGAVKWARHLMNDTDNDHVRIADVRGVAARNLRGAFEEIQATASRKCSKPFLIMEICPAGGMMEDKGRPVVDENGNEGTETSLWPVEIPQERYEMPDVLEACGRMEKAFPELADNARIIVEHEKEGRIHWHVTWSRIKADGKAVNFKLPPALVAARISWEMNAARGTPQPEGLKAVIDRTTRPNPSATLGESRQAQKIGMDAIQMKAQIKDAWVSTDTRGNTISELESSGFTLARGDKRGFVLVHVSGEVISLTRCGIKAAEAKARLGEPDNLPSVECVRNALKMAIQANSLAKLSQERDDFVEKTLNEKVLGPQVEELQALRREQRAERAAAARAGKSEQSRIRRRQRAIMARKSGWTAILKKMMKMHRLQKWARVSRIVFKTSRYFFDDWKADAKGLLSWAQRRAALMPRDLKNLWEKKLPSTLGNIGKVAVIGISEFDPSKYESAADELAPLATGDMFSQKAQTGHKHHPAKPLGPIPMQKPRL